MNARQESSNARLLREAAGRVRAELGYGTAAEMAEVSRGLAAACIQKKIKRVLIVAGGDHPAGELYLRNALTMIILAGIPDGFRLALVTPLPRTAHIYRNTQGDFNAAGVRTSVFEKEDDAVRWLDDGSDGARGAA